jgi:hypothetical protein
MVYDLGVFDHEQASAADEQPARRVLADREGAPKWR